MPAVRRRTRGATHYRVGIRQVPQIGHRKHCIADLDAFAATDDAVGECANGRPLVSEHRSENLLLRRIVAANDFVHTCDGIYRDIRAAEQRRHPAIVVRMTVRDDDGRERLLQRVDTRSERSPV
jgi:hypothetical protein